MLADDQTTSLSKSHRGAAFMVFVTGKDIQSLLDLYEIASDGTEIPGFIGGNHFSPFLFGPLKSDATKICTYDSLEEAEDICYPTQVGVWGSENLARLERIKEDIDPDYIFDCQKCVGNNRITNSHPFHEESANPSSDPMEEQTKIKEPQKDPKEATTEDAEQVPSSIDVGVDADVAIGGSEGAVNCYTTTYFLVALFAITISFTI